LSPETPATTTSDARGCPFCAWLYRDAEKPPVVYEDQHLIATLCESPISKGHTQIIFKTHYSELAVVDSEDSGRMGSLIPAVSAAIKNGLGAEMVYIACISEEVRHVHFHLVPRYADDTKGFSLFTRDRIALENVDETLDSLKRHMLAKAK